MSVFGRGRVRTLLLAGLSAAAMACAASHAFAESLPVLSPEPPLRFGDLADASPLVAVFDARSARDPAPDVASSAEPKFDPAPEQAPAAFVWNRHGEEHGASKDARLSTGYGDAAIQSHRSGPSSPGLLRFVRNDELGSIRQGHVPDGGADTTEGCPYVSRCAFARPRCREEAPMLETKGGGSRKVACHFPLD